MNKRQLSKYINFFGSVARDYITLLHGKKPTLLNISSFAAAAIQDYENNMMKSSYDFTHDFNTYDYKTADNIKKLLKPFEESLITFKDNKTGIIKSKLNDIVLYYTSNKKDDDYYGLSTKSFYSKVDDKSKINGIINFLFWEKYKSNIVTIYSKDNQIWFEEEEKSLSKYTEKALDFSSHFKTYIDKSINRSILFYGKPGTGKTSLVKDIINILGLKTIRISSNLAKTYFDKSLINEIIQVYQPDAIIFDDIDRDLMSTSDTLATIEEIHKSIKLFFATANNIKIIDEAFVRAGRFDQLIEIDKADPRIILDLAENDQDIFEIIKDFSIASMEEVMKRYKVLGKDYVLNKDNIKDIIIRESNAKDNENYKLIEKKKKKKRSFRSLSERLQK